MVVVALIGILAALSIPSVTQMVHSGKVREEVRTVHEALMEARNQARTRQQCTSITVDDPRHITWQVYENCPNLQDALTNNTAPTPADAIGGATRTYTISDSASIQNFSTGAEIVFVPPAGGLTDASPVTIDMVDSKSLAVARTFKIFPAIGTIRDTRP